jgi:hypothetical protein
MGQPQVGSEEKTATMDRCGRTIRSFQCPGRLHQRHSLTKHAGLALIDDDDNNEGMHWRAFSLSSPPGKGDTVADWLVDSARPDRAASIPATASRRDTDARLSDVGTARWRTRGLEGVKAAAEGLL